MNFQYAKLNRFETSTMIKLDENNNLQQKLGLLLYNIFKILDLMNNF